MSLALPYRHDRPAERTQRTHSAFVSCHVLLELACPEVHIAFRCIGKAAATVAVPEAAVDYHHGSVFRKDDIWAARQLRALQPEPEPKAVKHGANGPLGSGIAAPDSRHVPTTTFARKSVGHG